MADTVLRKCDGPIATLTLNRPDRFNALTLELVRELTGAFWELEADPDVRVILLKGAGKAWCAGGDLDELLALTRGTASQRRGYLTSFKAMIEAVRGVSKPIIASVQGVCVGGGNELNVACDLTLASETARFGQAGPRVGSVPVFGIPQDFQLLVGEKKSKEVTYLCRLYSAQEAEAMGWINRAVPAGDLDRVTGEWAREIAEKSPTALALAKRLHNLHHNLSSQAVDDGIELLTFFWGTEEAREGLTAFREKRKPEFHNA
ncbi:MAG: enoyl-CoA hydratase/isomerase family protein [Deltaproteobacteria bacterium]|nr:enoyl-CoA hydratase/isomerase family protein [Deltaproteobacteria bacterium]